MSTSEHHDIVFITDDEAKALARTVSNLFKAWDLTDAEARTLLGGISSETWSRWRDQTVPDLSDDVRMRMAHLMGIHKGIRTLFREPEGGYGWIKQNNDILNGRSPLDIMLGGELEHPESIREWLDSLCNA